MSLTKKLMKDVTQFRLAFGLEVNALKLTDEDKALHDSLINEELSELISAESRIDKIDAIVDSVYVLVGQQVHCPCESKYKVQYMIDRLIKTADFLEFDFEVAWDIVHESNMSKVCIDIDEAMLTQKKYELLGYEVVIEAMGHQASDNSTGNYFAVKNRHDVTLPCGKFVKAGKALKSINYRTADLSDL